MQFDGDDDLTAEEQNFFDTGGNADPVAKEVEPEETEEVDPEELDPDNDDPAPEAKDKKPKLVPHQALHQERETRKKFEQQFRQSEIERVRLAERLNVFDQLRQHAAQPEPIAPPDPDTDPVGALKYTQQQLAHFQQQEQQRVAYERQQSQESAQIAQIDGSYRSAWQDFSARLPDAMDGYNHFVKGLDGYFQALGVPAGDQRNQMIAQEERRITMAALQAGANPAEVIYNLAKSQGYTAKAAKVPAEKASEDIARRQKALPAARSMSGGQATGGDATASSLADMSDDEFSAVVDKMTPAQQRALFGG